MSLVLWTLALTAILLGLRALAAPLTARRSWKALLLPGSLLAILARSVACALAGAPLRHVNFPWREGEPVEHDPPWVPIAGGLVLGLVPFIAGTAAILLARAALGYPLEFDLALPPIDATPEGLGVFVRTNYEILHALWAMTPVIAVGWRAPAFLYLAVSTLVYAAPTWTEWKALAAGIAAIALVIWGCDYLGLHAGFLTRGWFIRTFYSERVFEALTLLLAAALVALLLFVVVRAGTAFARATLLPRRRSKGAR
jgi:hypothetical protein